MFSEGPKVYRLQRHKPVETVQSANSFSRWDWAQDTLDKLNAKGFSWIGFGTRAGVAVIGFGNNILSDSKEKDSRPINQFTGID
jgi:hypothetical protein